MKRQADASSKEVQPIASSDSKKVTPEKLQHRTEALEDVSGDRKKIDSGNKKELRSSSNASFGPEKDNIFEEYSLGRKNLKNSSIIKVEEGDPLSPRFGDQTERKSLKFRPSSKQGSAIKLDESSVKLTKSVESILDSKVFNDTCPQVLLDLASSLEYEKIVDEDGFELVDFQGNSRILKHVDDCNHFKLILNFELPSHLVRIYPN